jgi:hypothetical protein
MKDWEESQIRGIPFRRRHDSPMRIIIGIT